MNFNPACPFNYAPPFLWKQKEKSIRLDRSTRRTMRSDNPSVIGPYGRSAERIAECLSDLLTRSVHSFQLPDTYPSVCSFFSVCLFPDRLQLGHPPRCIGIILSPRQGRARSSPPWEGPSGPLGGSAKRQPFSYATANLLRGRGVHISRDYVGRIFLLLSTDRLVGSFRGRRAHTVSKRWMVLAQTARRGRSSRMSRWGQPPPYTFRNLLCAKTK